MFRKLADRSRSARGGDDGPAARDPFPIRDRGRHLGDHPFRLAHIRRVVLWRRVHLGIEVGEDTHRRAQHVHRMNRAGDFRKELDQRGSGSPARREDGRRIHGADLLSAARREAGETRSLHKTPRQRGPRCGNPCIRVPPRLPCPRRWRSRSRLRSRPRDQACTGLPTVGSYTDSARGAPDSLVENTFDDSNARVRWRRSRNTRSFGRKTKRTRSSQRVGNDSPSSSIPRATGHRNFIVDSTATGKGTALPGADATSASSR